MIRDNAIRFGAKHVAIEKAAYVQSTKTYQDLCMLQGALVYVLSTEGFEVTLYEPRKVKLEVSGSGSSDKATVADAVYGICGGDGSLSVDETDAVAVALCHIFTKQKASKLPA
jgi:crossover junction endodeoxyribonuclease RuvC